MATENNKTLISVIAPVYNEEAVIAQFIERIINVIKGLEKYDFELILVDDGSKDRSLQIIKDHAFRDGRIRVIELMRNYGQTSALSAGIDESKGNIIITMDSDLQHFPEEIPLFLEKIEDGYDLVCGWRKERQENIIRRWPSRVANYLIYKISGIWIHDFGTTFRAYRREILINMQLFGEMHRFIPAFASRLGCRIVEIPIQNINRQAGRSNYNLSRTYGVSLDLVFLYFYLNYITKPMRFFGLLAVFLFGSGFSIALIENVLAFSGIIDGNEHTALLLFSVLLMILGVNLLCYGLIVEVQNRIYFYVRKERIYNVRAIWQKNAKQ